MDNDKSIIGRQAGIDAAKGLGVLLVILGHSLYGTSVPQYVNQVIYSFHVPMFFVLAGYLQKQITHPGKFILKKIKRLFVPYLLYAFIAIFTFEEYKLWTVKGILVDIFFLKGHIVNNPLWFLIVLFDIYVICAVSGVTYLNKKFCVGLCIIAFGLAYIMFDKPRELYNYFGANRVVLSLGFFLVGMLAREFSLNKDYYGLLLFMSLIINFVFAINRNTKVSVYHFILGTDYISFLISAISGSVAVIMLCRLSFDRTCWFSGLSQYSILFLGTQYYLIDMGRWIASYMPDIAWIRDAAVFTVIALYIIVLPPIYRIIKERVPIIGVFNGEYKVAS